MDSIKIIKNTFYTANIFHPKKAWLGKTLEIFHNSPVILQSYPHRNFFVCITTNAIFFTIYTIIGNRSALFKTNYSILNLDKQHKYINLTKDICFLAFFSVIFNKVFSTLTQAHLNNLCLVAIVLTTIAMRFISNIVNAYYNTKKPSLNPATLNKTLNSGETLDKQKLKSPQPQLTVSSLHDSQEMVQVTKSELNTCSPSEENDEVLKSNIILQTSSAEEIDSIDASEQDEMVSFFDELEETSSTPAQFRKDISNSNDETEHLLIFKQAFEKIREIFPAILTCNHNELNHFATKLETLTIKKDAYFNINETYDQLALAGFLGGFENWLVSQIQEKKLNVSITIVDILPPISLIDHFDSANNVAIASEWTKFYNEHLYFDRLIEENSYCEIYYHKDEFCKIAEKDQWKFKIQKSIAYFPLNRKPPINLRGVYFEIQANSKYYYLYFRSMDENTTVIHYSDEIGDDEVNKISHSIKVFAKSFRSSIYK